MVAKDEEEIAILEKKPRRDSFEAKTSSGKYAFYLSFAGFEFFFLFISFVYFKLFYFYFGGYCFFLRFVCHFGGCIVII